MRWKQRTEALHEGDGTPIGELAAAGLRDDEIAQQLKAEGLRTGTDLVWQEDHVRPARRRNSIERTAADRPRMSPLPHRHPERGWFSIPGAMARFGVTDGIVRRWIANGIIRATRADFGTHRNVYWLEIDDVLEARLVARIRRPLES